MSAGAAAALTTPLDVVKTKLQTQGQHCVSSIPVAGVKRYRSVRGTIKSIMREEGWVGFTRGVLPRTLYFLPGSAIGWGTYEYIKSVIN